MDPFRDFDWDTHNWEVGGMLAMFFGIGSVVIFILEPVLTDRPLDPTLLAFGVGCLLFCWLAVEVTVQRKYGR